MNEILLGREQNLVYFGKRPTVQPTDNIADFEDISTFVLSVCEDLLSINGLEEPITETDVSVVPPESFFQQASEYQERCAKELYDLLPEEDRRIMSLEMFAANVFEKGEPWTQGGFYNPFEDRAIVLNQGALATMPYCVSGIVSSVFASETGIKGAEAILAGDINEKLSGQAPVIFNYLVFNLSGDRTNPKYLEAVEGFKESYQELVPSVKQSYDQGRAIQNLVDFTRRIPVPRNS
jgi:hypothetical protein